MGKTVMIFFMIMIFIASVFQPGYAQQKDDNMAAPLGHLTMHVIPQAHIDLAWWWRYDPETIHVVVKHTLETAFENMEKYPDYTFSFLQVPAIEPIEKYYPDLFYKMRYYSHDKRVLGERIRNPGAGGDRGRFAIASGLWCEVDGALPCGESLVRQCLYGKRYFRKEFGIDVKTAWFQDAWSHPWTYPQILKKSGIDSYMFARPRNEGEQMFWWQGPDGSRIFAYKPFKYKGESLPSQQELNNRLHNMNKKYGVNDDITLIGVGNHGGGSISADVERMKKIMEARQTETNTKNQPARLIFSTPQDFVNAVLEKKHAFPVINDELTPTIRGAYTTVGDIKKGNRQSENLLMTLEKFSAISSFLGEYTYPREKIFSCWKKVMLNQFHDTISGTDIIPSIEDALKRYKTVQETCQSELDNALQGICAQINTLGRGIHIVVFNPLAWERTDVSTIVLEFADPVSTIKLMDPQDNPVPIQIIERMEKNNKYYLRCVFVAQKVPSLGYKTFHAIPDKKEYQYSSAHYADNLNIENEFFKLQVDPTSGSLHKIFDKQAQRDVLAQNGNGNMIRIFEDLGDSEGFLESNKWTGQFQDVDSDPNIELIERGPVRMVLRVKNKFELARFTRRITLYNGIRRIDFDLGLDWDGKNKMVKVVFPLSVSSPTATYEIPYGTIRRPSEGEEHAAQKWVDISDDNYGISLLNDSRYGHDISENEIRLSVLRSPEKPVSAMDNIGVHTLRYSLYPHKFSPQAANSMQKGYEINYPLHAVRTASHKGKLPDSYSFVQITPDNLILTVLKKAEDSEDLILRCFETKGEKCIGKIILAKEIAIDAVHKINLMETGLNDIITDGTSFGIKAGAYSIESFKLIKDPF